MFTDNKDFYPTPNNLISKMWNKLDKRRSTNYILDPEAGKGNILEWIKEQNRYSHLHLCAIENDNNLRAVLQSKEYINVIDSDFLTFASPEKFDVILMNPPFSDGEYHLLKAIDIMYNGQIVCLLNAETIKNPYSNVRKSLVAKLKSLNAEVEYLSDTFVSAERRTDVDIALIYINIVRDVKDDMIDNLEKSNGPKLETIEEKFDITEKDNIFNIVKDFENMREIGINTISSFYTNYKIHDYLSIKILNHESDDRGSLTYRLSNDVNIFLTELRKKYWRKILSFSNIYKRLTTKKIDEFNELLKNNSALDFTVSNINHFIKNLVLTYEDTLTQATVDIFDAMSRKYAYDKNYHEKSTHYFDGWKTNEAYKVGMKVINPTYTNVIGWGGKWNLDYRFAQKLDDIDKVMNYFDTETEYTSMSKAIHDSFALGENKNIESTYFIVTIYKKGTIHFKFKSEDILRRFNITACKGKNFLPHDYGNKVYSDMTSEEKVVVNQFETVKKYEENVIVNSSNLFSSKSMMLLK